MELKSVPTQFKATSKREIEGHAAIFGNRDSYGDIIQPGAFARTLANDRGRVKVLWQHDPSNPIGKPLTMREDDRGLHVTARIADTILGRDAMALFDAEVVDELSIGYEAVVEEWDKDQGVRILREIKLYEFSPVTWAANELAKITAVKHASDLDMVLDRLERIQWARGRLESPRLRQKAEAAISRLHELLEGEAVVSSIAVTAGDLKTASTVAAPPGTPRDVEPAPDPVHAVIDELKAVNTRIRAANIARDLRAFGETLTRG